MITLFVAGLGLHGLNLLWLTFQRESRRLNPVSNLLNAVALTCGLIFSLNALLRYHHLEFQFALPAVGEIEITFDGLTLFFLFTFQLLCLAASCYAISYLSDYIQRGIKVRAHLWFFTLLILSLQLLVITHNALVFLILWELMALGAYFSILLERDKADVQRGAFWYFGATHASALLLYVCFVELHQVTGSWNFAAFARQATYDPKALTVILLTGFCGFAIKAGFMPFHVWLPNAHPAAPAHVSSLLSAINIKAGIYGLARLTMFLPPLSPAYGWGFLTISLISAIFGVWYALAQHDIKKLLAYHSVENIGIIGLGLAVAWLGRAYAQPELLILGFAGALLHTINHAIFKGLLFFGAGNVYIRSHTANIERMGGLARVVPLTAIAFLVGSIAICGLPPLNGFVSEFLIYKGFFRASNLLPGYSSIALVFAMVGLAFTGGLAVACFTKLYGIVFLAQNRSHTALDRQKEPRLAACTLLTLGALCALLGVFPGVGLRLVGPALDELATAHPISPQWVSPLGELQILFLGFVAFLAAGYGIKHWLQRQVGLRPDQTWGCGYQPVTPRMQYTASSFAEELVKLGRPMLELTTQWQAIRSTLPAARTFSSHCGDRIEKGWLFLNQGVGRLFAAFRWIQSGNIRQYVLYIFAAVAFYLLCALVW